MYLNGFKLCTCLNNASFFTDIPLDLPDGETDLYSGSATKVVQLIDYSVNQILSHPDRMRHYQRETTITNTYKADLPLRGICFTIAQGNIRETDTWRPFVEKREPWHWRGKHGGRILRTIDSRSALPFLNYEGQYSLQAGKQKKHYNLAYILLVHENFENVKLLVEALDDPTVFIYIHVDLASPNEFHEQIHSLAKEKSNIAVMGTQFSIIWGHMSLLWVEVRAFFDLLDLIEFDYVINLSGSDYPLKSAKTIYQTLERKPGSNWIYWSDGQDTGKEWELEMRTEHLFQCVLVPEEPNLKQCQFGFKNQGYEWRPWDGFKQLYPRRYKTSQWIILHSSAVKWLRTSEAGKLLMVWAENTLIPDEMILATLFASSPFVNKTYKDPKRLMRWLGNPHPESWWHEDKDDIWSWAKHFLWIRKVDLTEDPELKVILDEIRKWDVMGEEIVAPYADGIIPVD
jgi:Core-2/I-Branching enzyme